MMIIPFFCHMRTACYKLNNKKIKLYIYLFTLEVELKLLSYAFIYNQYMNNTVLGRGSKTLFVFTVLYVCAYF